MVDVQYNTELTELRATGLAITEIDLSSNTKLTTVSLLNEYLTAITISSLPELKGVVYIEKTDTQRGMVLSAAKTKTSWDGAKTWCSNYGSGWYLPSLDELKVIYNNKDRINFLLSKLGCTTLTDFYWSSNYDIYNSEFASIFNFSSGGSQGSIRKVGAYPVRAVLAF